MKAVQHACREKNHNWNREIQLLLIMEELASNNSHSKELQNMKFKKKDLLKCNRELLIEPGFEKIPEKVISER